MKKNLLILGIILGFVAVFTGCGKKETFSLKGCMVTAPDNKSVIIKSETDNQGDALCTVPANGTMKVLDFNGLQFKVNYLNTGKAVTGWVYVSDVCLDREIFLRSLKAALRMDRDARKMLKYEYKNLTFEDSMNSLNSIITYVGKEVFGMLNPKTDLGDVVYKALAVILNPEIGKDIPDGTTRQIHLLADCANRQMLEQFYPLLSDDYAGKCIDSQGLSCYMRSVQEKNLEALQFYDEKNIKEPRQNGSFHKDKNGDTLEDYYFRCEKGPLSDFIFSVIISSDENAYKFYEYLDELQPYQDFKMINILFDPVPFTEWKAEHPEENHAFVFMFDDNEPEWHFIDYKGVLNLRDSPGLSAKVVDQINYGTQVLITERSSQKSTINDVTDYWYKIQTKVTEGWCWGGYLAYPERVPSAKYAKGEGPVTCYSQLDFGEKESATVIKDSEILLLNGTRCPVRAYEEVTILRQLYDWEHRNFWDYGEADANSWASVYCPRYHYYLVRSKDYKTGILGGSCIAHEKLDKSLVPDSHDTGNEFYVNYLKKDDDFNGIDETCIYAELFEARKEQAQKLNPSFVLWEEPGPFNLGEHNNRKVYLADYCEFSAEYNFHHETDGEEILHMYSLILKSKGYSKFNEYSEYNACTVIEYDGRLEMFKSLETAVEEEENGESVYQKSRCNFVQQYKDYIPELKIEMYGQYIDYDSYEEHAFTGTHNYKEFSKVNTYTFDNHHLLFTSE